MQSGLLKKNWNRRLPPAQMCIKMMIATPTRLRHHVVRVTNPPAKMRVDQQSLQQQPVLPMNEKLDGYYSTSSIQPDNDCALKLLEFLQITKVQYKLTDYTAIQLLAYFKNDVEQACRHLHSADGIRLMVDFDAPWRVQSKSIRELPSLEQFDKNTYFKSNSKLIIVNPNFDASILPEQPLVEQYPGRCLRIQRSYHRGQTVYVGCVMPDDHSPLEVVSLMLPKADQREFDQCPHFLDIFEQYMASLVLMSKSWPLDQQQLLQRKWNIELRPTRWFLDDGEQMCALDDADEDDLELQELDVSTVHLVIH